MAAGGGVDELGIDAHLIAHAAHADFEDVFDAQLAGNALHIDCLAFESEA